MKLSIVIPVYRVEATLDRCLESVTNQSWTDFEVLLVDDGSPDKCPQMCDDWAYRDTRIKVIHKQNGGLSDARNAGIDQAQAEFITFIDSDDYLAPDTLSAIMPKAEMTDLLEYPICRNSGSAQEQLITFDDKFYHDADEYWLQAKAYLHTYACNKVYRRRSFADVRFPVGRAFEDAYTLPLLLQQRPRVATTGSGCYHYTANPQGITATATGSELRQLLDAHLHGGMPMDDAYRLQLLNIQLDVCRLTEDLPTLPFSHIKPQGSMKEKLKSTMFNILGIKNICTINKLMYSLCP